jgi:capsular exopolysaccharide synthesis family protein
VLVTSAAPGDGKTFVAISLALSIAAERDCGVLLVDGDCARRRATELFNAGARPGLTELLEDGKRSLNEVVVGTNIPGVRLLPAGQPDPNAAELLASRRMDEITRELTTTYSDYIVLFDSPPLLATNEAQVLARRMGQILFVVRSGETPHALVTEALELFAEDAHVSCVVNFASPNDASRYSGYEHYRKSSKRTA